MKLPECVWRVVPVVGCGPDVGYVVVCLTARGLRWQSTCGPFPTLAAARRHAAACTRRQRRSQG